MNPKQREGDKKTPHHLVPPRVLNDVAWIMKHGAEKYGPYNWRQDGINLSTYYSAARRHLDAWYEGEDIDPDSGYPHLAHVIANMLIVLDGTMEGNINDDRPLLDNK